MTQKLQYTFPDTDSNGDPFEDWVEAEDIPDYDEMDDPYEI